MSGVALAMLKENLGKLVVGCCIGNVKRKSWKTCCRVLPEREPRPAPTAPLQFLAQRPQLAGADGHHHPHPHYHHHHPPPHHHHHHHPHHPPHHHHPHPHPHQDPRMTWLATRRSGLIQCGHFDWSPSDWFLQQRGNWMKIINDHINESPPRWSKSFQDWWSEWPPTSKLIRLPGSITR